MSNYPTTVSNTELTISMITRESLMVLKNNLKFTAGVNREYSDKFAIEGAKIGTTLNVRKPPRYAGRTGATLSVENSVDTSVPLVLTTQFGVDIAFSSADLQLSIDEFSNRYIKPAVAVVANKIDYDGLQLYKQVANQVGTPGTIPSALLPFLTGGVKITNGGAPVDGDRACIVNPLTEATIVNAYTGLFNPTDAISKQYESGNMGRAIGFNWSMDQNVAVHTCGTAAATTTVATTSVDGATTLVFTAAAAGAYKAGDTFTVASVFSVNPQSRQSTGILQDFLVTADNTTTTVAIYPTIISTGQLQTVNSLPQSGATITPTNIVSGRQTPQGLIFHKDAFTLATADLPLPGGVDMAARVSDEQTGISIRMVRAYDIVTDLFPCRLDVLYGWKCIYPELACRVYG